MAFQRLPGPLAYRSQPGEVRNSQGGENVTIPEPNWLLITAAYFGSTSTETPWRSGDPSQVTRTSVGQRTCQPHWLAITRGRHW